MNQSIQKHKDNSNFFTDLIFESPPVAFISVCILVKTLLALSVYFSGFRALGGDDWQKMSIVLGISHNAVWAPLQFWLLDIFFKVIKNIYLASILLNWVSSVGVCIILYMFARYLFDNKIARLSLILLIFFPWHIWTSISMQSEALYSFFFIGSSYFLIRWSKESKVRWLYLLSVSCFILTMLRYQGWLVASMITAYLIISRMFSLRPYVGWKQIALLLILVWAFPITYLSYHAYISGDPFAWYPHLSQLKDFISFNAWIRVTKWPFYFFLVVPLLSPFVIIGLRVLWILPKPERFSYALMSYGYIVALILYSIMTKGYSGYAEQRYILPSVILLIPLIVYSIYWITWKEYWKYTFLILVCIWGVFSTFRVTKQYVNPSHMAGYIQELYDNKSLLETQNIYINIYNPNRLATLFDVKAVYILSGHPFQILGKNSEECKEFQNAFENSNGNFKNYLQKNRLNMIFANDPVVVKKMTSMWSYFGSVVGYKIFIPENFINKEQINQPSIPSYAQNLEQQWNNGVKLINMIFLESETPHNLSLKWSIPTQLLTNTKARLVFLPLNKDLKPLEVTFPIGGGLYPINNSEKRIESDDFVEIFHLAEDGREGRYQLYLELLDNEDNIVPLKGEIDDLQNQSRLYLTTFDLIYSKTHALHNFITGRTKDWGVMLRILFSLIN